MPRQKQRQVSFALLPDGHSPSSPSGCVLFIIIIIIIIVHSPRTAEAADFFMISEKVGPSSFDEVDITLCFDLMCCVIVDNNENE
jgi:hypothetical protein